MSDCAGRNSNLRGREFSLPVVPGNLSPSYKTDIDFRDGFEGGILSYSRLIYMFGDLLQVENPFL